jgi:hypothetical protein
LAALTLGAKGGKDRAGNYFPSGSGAVLNMNEEKFESTIVTEDQLMFLYLFDST